MFSPVAYKQLPGGYGISWSEDIALNEYELWTNGKTAPIKSLKTNVAKSRHAD